MQGGFPKSTDVTTIRLRERGALTLPKTLRDRYGLVAGNVIHVLDLGGVFVIAPAAPAVPTLACEIERLRVEAGLSTDELLGGLRRERDRYARERFGVEPDDTSD